MVWFAFRYKKLVKYCPPYLKGSFNEWSCLLRLFKTHYLLKILCDQKMYLCSTLFVIVSTSSHAGIYFSCFSNVLRIVLWVDKYECKISILSLVFKSVPTNNLSKHWNQNRKTSWFVECFWLCRKCLFFQLFFRLLFFYQN